MAKSRARQWADILANTPVYADANGNLTVDTNTLYVDATNNRVGIGTTPTSDFHHYKNASAVVQRIQNQTSGMQFQMNDGVESGAGVIYMEGSGPLTLWTGGSQRMRITGAGNVGIGTTSPQVGCKAEISSDIDETSTYSAQLALNAVTQSAGNLARILFYHASHGSASIASDYESSGYGNLIFSTRGGGNPTERMRIDGSGRVTLPYQPGFYTRRSIAGDGRGVGAQEWSVSGTGSFNTGSHFNTSNGRFTAPVAGVYAFTAAPGYKQTSINFSWVFRVNGNTVAEPVRILGGLDSHSLATGTLFIYLNVNDYFDIYMYSTHHVNTTTNFFCGFLIG